MRILVTGGAGFIGSHVCERLLGRGDEVVVVDDLNDFYNPLVKQRNLAAFSAAPGLRFYQADIRDAAAMRRIFADQPFDGVVHLAARAGVRPSLVDPILYEEVNVIGTLNLLELCREMPVRNFVFGSSSSVYGINSKLPFNEDDPIAAPISPYATTKRSGELHCFNYAHLYGIPATCLRFFTVYGPRQRPDLAIHKFTKRMLAGDPIEVYGDGSSRRDYTYVDDIVEGILAALDHPAPFEIVNLGNSSPITLNGLLAAIESATGRTALRKAAPDQPGDVPATFADITKAERLWGWTPKTTLGYGLQRFVAWMQSQGEAPLR